MIISLGQNEGVYEGLPANIQIYDRVDQIAVLGIADVFLTHCGMNSVSEGLYFETPLLLYPQTPEQAAVARRVAELGAGELLRANTSQEILRLTGRLLETDAYQERAAAISRSFKDSGGTPEARAFLEDVWRASSPQPQV